MLEAPVPRKWSPMYTLHLDTDSPNNCHQCTLNNGTLCMLPLWCASVLHVDMLVFNLQVTLIIIMKLIYNVTLKWGTQGSILHACRQKELQPTQGKSIYYKRGLYTYFQLFTSTYVYHATTKVIGFILLMFGQRSWYNPLFNQLSY